MSSHQITVAQFIERLRQYPPDMLVAMPVPNFKRLFKDYDTVDVGGFGEFDTFLLVAQLASKVEAQKIYPAWRGGYYYAVRPKGKPSAPLGLLYVSRWSSAEKASEFAEIYAKGLAQRYGKVVEAPVKDDRRLSMTASHVWTTEEGAVLIHVRGDLVLVAEDLDHEELLPGAVLGVAAERR